MIQQSWAIMAFDISQLSSPVPADQLRALRLLKNEIVGHVHRKQQAVQAGVLKPVLDVLQSPTRINGNGAATADLTNEEYLVKLQALQLLASFSNAGPVFLHPLHAAGILPAIVSAECLQHERPQVVLAALRVLRGIVDAARLAPARSPMDTSSLADALFSNGPLESFALILDEENSCREAGAQATIVAHIIGELCREERHQLALVNAGVLDALATRLASFAVAQGQAVPHLEVFNKSEGLAAFIPEPAKAGLQLSDVLSALAAVMTDSRYRACRLLYSPSILAVFPNTDGDYNFAWRGASEHLELPGVRPTRVNGHGPMDLLLPYMPSQLRSQTSAATTYPQLATSTSDRVSAKPRNREAMPWNPGDDQGLLSSELDGDDAESPLVPWLINLVRNLEGLGALMAASVLTSLYKCGFTYRLRENTLALLVIPKLVQTLNAVELQSGSSDTSDVDASMSLARNIIEQTPAILSRLITDSENLQKAAFEAGAGTTLVKLLKSTYNAPPSLELAQPWSPTNSGEAASASISQDRVLGEFGEHPLLEHRVRLRGSSLKAIGALVAFKEEYRTAIVALDVMPYIAESLRPNPGLPKQPKERANSAAKSEEGRAANEQISCGYNPKAVMIGACYAIRMLSRSCNILRTALIDNGVAVPLYRLMGHPDADIKVAATAAVCNLVIEFSPLRNALTEVGVVKTLCEHSKSQNASLRLNALWALKHFVNGASFKVKKECLEELHSGWLVKLICDDTEDEALFSARARGDKQPSTDSIVDTDEVMDLDDHSRSTTSQTSAGRRSEESRILRLAEARLAALREVELNPIRKARKDDLDIQEQGLDFIRNLIGSSGSDSMNVPEATRETTEMIDHLFNTLGQDRFFSILAQKLKPKYLHQLNSRRGPNGNEARVLYPQAKIIEAVVFILVHIAASVPHHRQLVIAQTELLRLLAGLFNSQDRAVRVALCHLINNLTWQDDVSDASACSQRAIELKKLGFLTKLESLGQTDDELDVRERAKSALWQMRKGY